MVTTQCPHCGVTIEVEEKYLGKKGRCNKCKEVFVVPAAEESAPAVFQVEFDESADAGSPSGLFRGATLPTDTGAPNPFLSDAGAGAAGGATVFAQFTEGAASIEPSGEAANPFGDLSDDPFAQAPSEPFVPMEDNPFAAPSAPVAGAPAHTPVEPWAAAPRATPPVREASPAASVRPASPPPPSPAAPHPVAPPPEKPARPSPAAGASPPTAKPKLEKAPPLRRAEPVKPTEVAKAPPVEPPRAKPDRPTPRPAPTAAPRTAEPPPRPHRVPVEAPPAVKPPAVRPAVEIPPASVSVSLTAPKIEAVEAFLVQLPAKGTFLLAGGTHQSKGQPTPRILVKLVGSDGSTGWGEATPCPSWCYETSESILSTIRRYLAPAVVGLPAWNIDQVVAAMERVIQPGATIGQPLAKSAVDTALHDMLARSLHVPLHVLLGGKRVDQVLLSYVVSAHTADEAAYQTQEGLNLGYMAFKVKVGIHEEALDRRIVRAVVDTAPSDAFLWVDANQGYSMDTAIRQAHFFAKLGVQAFEQPLKGSRISAFQRLVRLHKTPIAIDETLGSAADLLEYIRQDAVDLPVVKLQRCGGYWHSRQFGAVAEAAGLRLMGSGLCETDLGLAHGLQLFAAFGIRLPCDLNGRQFVESPFIRESVVIKDGFAAVPDQVGCGVLVDEEKVRRLAVEP